MTTVERYSGAIGATNLRVKESTGDVDLLIAAGLAGQPNADTNGERRFEMVLASSLLRLNVEYDIVRGEHRAAEARLRSSEAAAKRKRGDGASAEDGDRADAMVRDAEAVALTDHALILSMLPSLRGVKDMMVGYACAEATRLRFMAPPEYVLRLTGSVLDVHLSPACRTCNGAGYTGNLAKGEAPKVCRTCKGTASRIGSVGRDEDDRVFAGVLLMKLNALVERASNSLAHKRAVVREAKAMIRRAEAAATPS